MQNVLITGGAGYIGSILVKKLLPYYNVTVIDNLMYDATSLLPFIGQDNFSFVNGDVRDHSILKKYLAKNDIIIPLAALVGAALCEKLKIDALDINQKAIEYLVSASSKDQLFLYPNTNSGYGTTDGQSVITELDPLTPVSVYGTTKCAAENAVRTKENHVVFRLATVFGPSTRMRTDLLINNLVFKALKDKVLVVYQGAFMRNYIHIEDVCDAFLFALQNWSTCKNEIYNVGNDAINMSKLQMCHKIKEHIPVEVIEAQFTEDPDKRNYIVSSDKLYKKGYSCKYDLDCGIRQLIKVFGLIDAPVYGNY